MKLINFNDRLCHTNLVLKGLKTMKREYITAPTCYKGEAVYGFNVHPREKGVDEVIMINGNGEEIKGAYIKPKYEIGEVVALCQNYRDIDDFYAAAAAYKYGKNEVAVPAFDRLTLDDLTKWEKESFSLSKDRGWKNKKYVKADLMPHHIRITNIKVENIQDIPFTDCLREGILKEKDKGEDGEWHEYYRYNGVTAKNFPHGRYVEYKTAYDAFKAMYQEMYGKDAWEYNTPVFVYEFELVQK